MSLPLPANHVPLWTAHASYTKLRCYARCNRPRRSVAKRSYPSPKVRGSGQECQAATAQERLRAATLRPGLGRWPRGATPRLRLGRWPRGATPRPRLGRRPRVVTPHPSLGGGREEQPPVQGAEAVRGPGGPRGATPHSRSGGAASEEIPLIQGKEQRLQFAGAAMKRYPTSKVRETQVRQ